MPPANDNCYALIITGSRKWPEDSNEHTVIIRDQIVRAWTLARLQGYYLIVVHGDSPKGGADKVADQIVRHSPFFKFSIDVKPFPADWNKHGRKAGPIRNRDMVKYVLDQGFVKVKGAGFYYGDPSPGTRDCIKVMKGYDIPVTIHDDTGALLEGNPFAWKENLQNG